MPNFRLSPQEIALAPAFAIPVSPTEWRMVGEMVAQKIAQQKTNPQEKPEEKDWVFLQAENDETGMEEQEEPGEGASDAWCVISLPPETEPGINMQIFPKKEQGLQHFFEVIQGKVFALNTDENGEPLILSEGGFKQVYLALDDNGLVWVIKKTILQYKRAIPYDHIYEDSLGNRACIKQVENREEEYQDFWKNTERSQKKQFGESYPSIIRSYWGETHKRKGKGGVPVEAGLGNTVDIEVEKEHIEAEPYWGYTLSTYMGRMAQSMAPLQRLLIGAHCVIKLAELADMREINRDIKDKNFCIMPAEKDPYFFILTIIDLDLSLELGLNSHKKLLADTVYQRAQEVTQDDCVGTAYFLSPEAKVVAPLTPASDLYSLSILLDETLGIWRIFDEKNDPHFKTLYSKTKNLPPEKRPTHLEWMNFLWKSIASHFETMRRESLFTEASIHQAGFAQQMRADIIARNLVAACEKAVLTSSCSGFLTTIYAIKFKYPRMQGAEQSAFLRLSNLIKIHKNSLSPQFDSNTQLATMLIQFCQDEENKPILKKIDNQLIDEFGILMGIPREALGVSLLETAASELARAQQSASEYAETIRLAPAGCRPRTPTL